MGIVLQGTVVTATNMKLLIVLALVGLVYGDAKPQWLLPGVTLKTAEGDTPSIYTATYGHAGLPLTYGGILPYSGFYNGLHPYSGLSPFHYPLVTVAKPAEEGAAVEAARKKRSAEPEAEAEPEADPQLLLSTGLHTPYTYPLSYSSPLTYSTAYHPISYTYLLGTSYGFGGYPLLSTLAAAKE